MSRDQRYACPAPDAGHRFDVSYCRLDVSMDAPGTYAPQPLPRPACGAVTSTTTPPATAPRSAGHPWSRSRCACAATVSGRSCTAAPTAGTVHLNRIAGDDNPLVLMRLAVRPLAQPPFPLELLGTLWSSVVESARGRRRGWTRLPAPCPNSGRAVALLVVMLVLPAMAHAAAEPGCSRERSARFLKGGHATVRAVEVAGGTVVAGEDVGRPGAFSLRLPAGAYVVRGVVVPRRGAVVTKAIAVSLKRGQRRSHTKLTARKRRLPKKATERASAAYVTERGNLKLGTVAAGIYQFAGPSGGDLGYFAKGFHELLITDVVEEAPVRCKGHVVVREVERMAELLREFELGKSPYADKSTFPKRNLIIVDVAVHGTITQLPDGTVRGAGHAHQRPHRRQGRRDRRATWRGPAGRRDEGRRSADRQALQPVGDLRGHPRRQGRGRFATTRPPPRCTRCCRRAAATPSGPRAGRCSGRAPASRRRATARTPTSSRP